LLGGGSGGVILFYLQLAYFTSLTLAVYDISSDPRYREEKLFTWVGIVILIIIVT